MTFKVSKILSLMTIVLLKVYSFKWLKCVLLTKNEFGTKYKLDKDMLHMGYSCNYYSMLSKYCFHPALFTSIGLWLKILRSFVLFSPVPTVP